MIKHLYAIQIFRDDVWQTTFLTSYIGDAYETYEAGLELFVEPARLALFSVQGVDFVATYARNFRVLEAHG